MRTAGEKAAAAAYMRLYKTILGGQADPDNLTVRDLERVAREAHEAMAKAGYLGYTEQQMAAVLDETHPGWRR